MNFTHALRAAAARNRSRLCVGLDPQRIPAHLHAHANPLYQFCSELVEATADLACAFKPNIAFFEARGPAGLATLQRLIAAMPRDVPVIVDAKRGDIGSTAQAYAEAIFGQLGADAVTLNPYLGADALAPFLAHADKGCFILCKTSNAGSGDFQDLALASGEPLYLAVARKAQHEWNQHSNAGLVVGATYPAVLAQVRAVCPSLPLLVPGVGAQGGDLAGAAQAAADSQGGGFLINASRSIMYASDGPDFATAARAEALRLRDLINDALVPGASLA